MLGGGGEGTIPEAAPLSPECLCTRMGNGVSNVDTGLVMGSNVSVKFFFFFFIFVKSGNMSGISHEYAQISKIVVYSW